MTDQLNGMTAFELRLARVLAADGETAVRPIDAEAVAETSMLLGRRRAATPSWAWLAAAATLALLLVALAALGAGSHSPLFSWLNPAPTPTATLDAGVPTVLRAQWVGSPRSIDGTGESPGTTIVIDGTSLCVTGRDYNLGCTIVRSAATAGAAADELRLETLSGSFGCGAGTVGTYRWSASTGGGRLTLEAMADACQTRSAALAGTWYRSDCRNTADSCLGLLEAGTYPSQFLHLKGAAGTYPPSDFGAITYTVPDGWANSGDWPVVLSLTPATDYATEGSGGAIDGAYHELDLFAHPQPAARGSACDGAIATDITDPSAAGFKAWLMQQPAFDVTDQGSLTVAGLPAVGLDIRLAADYGGQCLGETVVSADYLLLRDDTGRGFTPRLRGPEVARLILVDLGASELLAIVIDSSDPARFDSLVAASMPIVSSLVIR